MRLAARIRLFAQRLKRHWISLTIALICALIIFSGNTARGALDIYSFFFPQPDALQVAQEGSKAELSRDFVETNWRRLFRARNFIARVGRQAPPKAINDAWNLFIESVDEGASKNMVYILFFSQSFADGRRDYYEGFLSEKIKRVTDEIADFRYNSIVSKLMTDNGVRENLSDQEITDLRAMVNKVTVSLDSLNVNLYLFANCFDEQHSDKQRCSFSPANISS